MPRISASPPRSGRSSPTNGGCRRPNWHQFREGLAPLLAGGKLGVLLAQFPYSFHNTEENRAYLVQLKAALPEFPLAVEVRHRSWQQRAVREFLEAAGLDFCNIDQPMVSYPMGATRWVTGTRGYLRCHGRRARGLV